MTHRRWTSLLLFLVVPTLLRADDSKPMYPPPADVRAAFHKLLDRPAVPLDVKVDEKKTENGLTTERLSFASEKHADGKVERTPALVVRPEKGDKKLPAVIVLHGTGGSKEGLRGWLTDLAKRGILGIAIDARYHGERAGGAKGSAAYVEAITRAWETKTGEPMEHPFYYDTCWDIWKTIDYLQQRDDVDPDRIGMIGISMGGIETWLAGSADDRVRVLVPAIAVQSFRWSLDNDKWQGRANTIKGAHEAAARDLGEPMVNQKVCRALWSKVIPGILDQFDCPSMLRLCAGRPQLILSGEKDPNCPLEGAKLAFAAAEAAYKDAKADDRLKIVVAEGVGHSVTDDEHKAALDWFERWLKP
jgi:dienelactone hydrolase